MFITSREKAIIELIIKTSGKHTALSIATYLDVSVRTIQRDLKAVEKILRSFDLHLTRNTNEGLVIEGKNEQIFRLIQFLTGSNPIDQTPQERKLLLLLSLLQGDSYKIQALAVKLSVSVKTLTTYLDELTDWLSNFNIEISRKRGVGVELAGAEANKRKALASYFLLYFNEELIESLFLLENGQHSFEKVVHYFHPDYLLSIDESVPAVFNKEKLALADNDYVRLVVHICITMQRTEAGFLLEENADSTSELANELNLITKVCDKLEAASPLSIRNGDRTYLAVILRGSKLRAADSVPYDSVLLGQKIKNIIQHVSALLHVDLAADFSLYQGLLAHMEPSLFRLKQKMGLFNPLTADIKRKYPVLFMAVKTSIEQEFSEIDFPDDEIAFIVLHFGSALVMKEEEISIKALVVCPTGIGTAKMLASRIKREIIEIDAVEIKSIKDIQQQESLKDYDVIISTVRLPFHDLDYILVSPLLNEENILSIRGFLERNLENFTKNKHDMNPKQRAAASGNATLAITDLLQELKDVQQSVESVLDNFRFFREPLSDYQRIIEKMVRMAEKEKLLTNADAVVESLKKRESKGGLGIPNTPMGLFHSRHRDVHELIFQVAHLDKPSRIKGMDGSDIHMENLLLMLAPEELSTRQQEIVSLISTSLIESTEAIMIFSSSNKETIRGRLETIFLDYLHTKLIRE